MSHTLFLAVAEEHKQRTRHDVFRRGPLDTTHITCDVCSLLTAEARRYEKAELQYYEEQRTTEGEQGHDR